METKKPITAISEDLLKEIINYKGKLLPVPNAYVGCPELVDIKDLGILTLFESKALTICILKRQKRNEIISSICGKNMSEMNEEDIEKVSTNIDTEQSIRMMQLTSDSEDCIKYMWKLIHGRVETTSIYRRFRILPGYRLISGVNIERMITKVFGEESFDIDKKAEAIKLGFDIDKWI